MHGDGARPRVRAEMQDDRQREKTVARHACQVVGGWWLVVGGWAEGGVTRKTQAKGVSGGGVTKEVV